MMPRRNRDPRWCAPTPDIQSGHIEMLSRDNQRMREAGCNLAEAATRVVRDYDGLHRLSIAISQWFTAIANEGDRDERHASGIETEGRNRETGSGAKHESPTGEAADAQPKSNSRGREGGNALSSE